MPTKGKRMGLSESEYARHLGISQPAVNQAKRAGRVALFPDGSIDMEKSDELYFALTDLEQSERGRINGGSEGRATPRTGTARSIQAEQYMRAKTLQNVMSTQIMREKYARMRGEVVDRATAQNIVFGLARRERDAWLQWPTRVAAAIAAELGTPEHPIDIHQVQTCLEMHIHVHLSELPEIDPEPFPFAGEDEFGEEVEGEV